MKHLLVSITVGVGLGLAALSSPAVAEAGSRCEHRDIGHIDKHGGEKADDAYHRARGERTTCENDDRYTGKRTETSDDERKRWETHPPTTTRVVPVPEPVEGDDGDSGWSFGRHKNRWWRND